MDYQRYYCSRTGKKFQQAEGKVQLQKVNLKCTLMIYWNRYQFHSHHHIHSCLKIPTCSMRLLFPCLVWKVYGGELLFNRLVQLYNRKLQIQHSAVKEVCAKMMLFQLCKFLFYSGSKLIHSKPQNKIWECEIQREK